MTQLRLNATFIYVDKFGRNVFLVGDESAEKIRRLAPDVDPGNLPVKSKIPLDTADLGRPLSILVRARRFKLVSKLPHNVGEIITGVSFTLVDIKNI